MCVFFKWNEVKYILKSMVSLLFNKIPNVGKASGSRLCTVCAEKYKTDSLSFFLFSSLNIRQDLKLYVVLPVLQHKTFIINLSNRAYLTFTSYTSYQIVHFFFCFPAPPPGFNTEAMQRETTRRVKRIEVIFDGKKIKSIQNELKKKETRHKSSKHCFQS